MKRLEQLMRNTFGVVTPEVTTKPSGPETIVDPWPLETKGVQPYICNKLCDLPDLGPYSSAYWL